MSRSNAPMLILGGIALYALSRRTPSDPNDQALNSPIAHDALANIANTYGDDFAQQVNDAAHTATNAAEMFEMLGYKGNVIPEGAGKTVFYQPINDDFAAAGVNLVSAQKNPYYTALSEITHQQKIIANLERQSHQKDKYLAQDPDYVEAFKASYKSGINDAQQKINRIQAVIKKWGL